MEVHLLQAIVLHGIVDAPPENPIADETKRLKDEIRPAT
jgi:hypothetical protein